MCNWINYIQLQSVETHSITNDAITAVLNMADRNANNLTTAVILNLTSCLLVQSSCRRQKVEPHSLPATVILLALNIASPGPCVSYRPAACPFERENTVQKKACWGDKNLTETNDVLAAPDQRAQIHEKQKTDGCEWRGLHDRRELDFTEANKMDGCRASHPVSTASGSDRGVCEVRPARHILQTTRREDRHASK